LPYLVFIIFRNVHSKKNEILRNKKRQAELATGCGIQNANPENANESAFYFNSLNSINSFILENNKPNSSGITKFSRLIE
jgi:hypothetical protein